MIESFVTVMIDLKDEFMLVFCLICLILTLVKVSLPRQEFEKMG